MAFAVNGVEAHHFKAYELVFIRCRAVIDILFDDPTLILSYAEKLDQRISSSTICQ
jgi:hypothetical protein